MALFVKANGFSGDNSNAQVINFKFAPVIVIISTSATSPQGAIYEPTVDTTHTFQTSDGTNFASGISLSGNILTIDANSTYNTAGRDTFYIALGGDSDSIKT